MTLFTIGFTQSSAQHFFDRLREHQVDRIVDIRLNPDGQLSGFAKRHDLAYFLQELNRCGYVHVPALAPEESILRDYRHDHQWNRYVERFERLMDQRGIPASLDERLILAGNPCLLCSEAEPSRCHRRLLAERFARTWPQLEVVHL